MTALLSLLSIISALIRDSQPLPHFLSAEDLVNQIEEDNDSIDELGEPKLEPNEFYTVGEHPFTLQTHRGDENGPVIAKMVRARVSLCSVRARTPARSEHLNV